MVLPDRYRECSYKRNIEGDEATFHTVVDAVEKHGLLAVIDYLLKEASKPTHTTKAHRDYPWRKSHDL